MDSRILIICDMQPPVFRDKFSLEAGSLPKQDTLGQFMPVIPGQLNYVVKVLYKAEYVLLAIHD